MAALLPPPSPTSSQKHVPRESDDEDADTASQRSISLSSPPTSRRNSELSDPRHSFTTQSSDSESRKESNAFVDNSDAGADDEEASYVQRGAPATFATPVIDEPRDFKPITYPPSPPNRDDTMSITSFASTSSRKARPESLIIAPTTEPLVLGVALVDFNHLVSYLASNSIQFAEMKKIGWTTYRVFERRYI